MSKLPIDRLGVPGKDLLNALSTDNDSFAIGALILEAARVADRLERLDLLLSGDENAWLTLENGRLGVVQVRIDGALTESRQQQAILDRLINSIARLRGDAPGPTSEDDDLDGI